MEYYERNNCRSEKPPVLYHGSPQSGLEQLSTSARPHRGPDAELFATQELPLAICFLARTDFVSQYDGIPYVVIVGSRETFINSDRGGTIYTLPSDTFKCNPHRGLRGSEWYTTEPVTPVEKTTFPSALEAMIDHGVQVYFMDAETYRGFIGAKDYRERITMLERMTSENQRQRRQVRTLILK